MTKDIRSYLADNEDILREIAQDYIRAGIAVVPLSSPLDPDQKTAGKRPLTTAWQRHRLDEAAFFAVHQPGGNIGIITGKASRLICVDLDKKSGGMQWYEAHKDLLGRPLVETTGGGGLHLYYRYPDGVDHVPSVKPEPGVEILADGGHQCVTWPSMHKDGKPYRLEDGYTLLDVEHRADVFPGWLRCITSAKDSFDTTKGKPPPAYDAWDAPENIAWVRRNMHTFKKSISHQLGNDTTYKQFCRMFNDRAISPGAAWPLALEYNQKMCIPPWSEKELRPIFDHACRYAKRPFGCEVPAVHFKGIPVEETPADPKEVQRVQEELKGPYNPKFPNRCTTAFLDQFAGRIKFDTDNGYVYDEQTCVWAELPETKFKSLIREDIKARSPQAMDKVKPTHTRDIAESVRQELNEEDFEAKLDTWTDGRHGDYIRLENGILNIREQKLLPHDPRWFSFNKLPFHYDPFARCPKFHAFLESIWPGNQDAKDCLQLWMGYLLLSESNAQKFALFIGASRAGKGVLTKTIRKLLGEGNCASPSLTALAQDFGLSDLYDKKLAVLEDAVKAHGSLGDIATERLISIVGQDPQTVNRKFKDPMTVRLPLRIILVCNEIPQFVNNRNALVNRMLVFPFEKTFLGTAANTKLESELAAELPGILIWSLEGARRVIGGEPLRQPESATEVMEGIKEQLNPIYGFIKRCVGFPNLLTHLEPWDVDPIEPDPDAEVSEEMELAREMPKDPNDCQVSTQHMYEAFRVDCERRGRQPCALDKFSKQFPSLCPEGAGVLKKRNRQRKSRLFNHWCFTNCFLRKGVWAEFDEPDRNHEPLH